VAKQELVFRKTGLAAGGFFKEKLEIPAVKQVKRRQGSSIQEGDDKPKSSLRRPLRSTGSV
jgi:hypothetical protein